MAGVFGLPDEFMAYHWAPTSRRDSILAGGLRIRQESHSAPIRYPYVAFALDPVMAWGMSGDSFPDVKGPWDLWGVWSGYGLNAYEVIPTDDNKPRELRTYRSVPARHVRYIATRDGSVAQNV